MKLLITISEERARFLNDQAQEWLRQNTPGYNAGQWSDIYTDGFSFGIIFEPRLVPAFEASDLGTDTRMGEDGQEYDFYVNVIDATDGAPGWSVVPPPAPEDQP